MNTTEEIVSVPYRGYSFFNLRKFKNLNVNIKNIEFPSLTGVIRFLINTELTQKACLSFIGFRPLQGLFVF